MLNPIGFWSYSSTDDEHSRGRLSQLRALLAAELQQKIGRSLKVNIFQDVAAIPPGAEWEKQIRDALNASFFAIPIVTPALLQSEWCCREITFFRKREATLGRNDLIFPLHYVSIDSLDASRPEDCHDPDVLYFLRTRQWIDFRTLRLKTPESEEVALKLESLADSSCSALRRTEANRAAEPVQAPVASHVAADHSESNSCVIPVDTPSQNRSKYQYQFSIGAGTLKRILNKTLFAMSADPTRYYLNGLYLHPNRANDGSATLRVVATDGHRLAVVDIQEIAGLSSMPGLILHRDSAYQLFALLADVTNRIDVAASKTEIVFTIGGRSYTYQLIDGTYPDYKRAIPSGRGMHIRAPKRDLMEGVQKILLNTPDPKRAVRISLAGTNLRLDLNLERDQNVTQVEVMPVTASGSLIVGFSGHYLQDILQQIDGDVVDIIFDGKENSALFREGPSVNYSYVLMPMRIAD